MKEIFGFGDSEMLGIHAHTKKQWLLASLGLSGIYRQLLLAFGQVLMFPHTASFTF